MLPNTAKMGMSGPAGLQLKGKAKFGLQKPVKKPASGMFAADEDDNEDGERERANNELRRMMGGQQDRAAVQAAQQEAISQDASVYDYDGVYDQMKEDTKTSHVVVGRPKEQKQ